MWRVTAATVMPCMARSHKRMRAIHLGVGGEPRHRSLQRFARPFRKVFLAMPQRGVLRNPRPGRHREPLLSGGWGDPRWQSSSRVPLPDGGPSRTTSRESAIAQEANGTTESPASQAAAPDPRRTAWRVASRHPRPACCARTAHPRLATATAPASATTRRASRRAAPRDCFKEGSLPGAPPRSPANRGGPGRPALPPPPRRRGG